MNDGWLPYVETLPWQRGQLDPASYHAFLRAGSLAVDPQTAFDVVTERIHEAGGLIRSRKLESQLRRAYSFAEATACESLQGIHAKLYYHRKNPWPDRDATLIRSIIGQGFSLADLWESSPVRFDDEAARTELVIDALFPGNPLLCVGRSKFRFDTDFREALRGALDQAEFIVPCCMTSKTGVTLEGKESAHCLANTGPRQHLVIEFDQGGIDEQAALIHYLAQRGPLVLVVHSRGKSLHAWFRCDGQPEPKLRPFMNCAVRLGADKATWSNRSQFVRMPDGLRNPHGNRQTVFFFNPQGIK